MATALSVISSAISIFNFAEGLFPEPKTYHSKLKIYVGFDTQPTADQDSLDNGYRYNGNDSNSGSLTNAAGRCPDIRLWDDAENFLGITNDDSYIQGGNYAQKEVNHGSNNADSAYGVFTANDDAICMAYILKKWPDGQSYGWTGGFGRVCGHSWYPSSVSLGGHYTNCVWLSNNGAATDVTAIQVHFLDFEDNDLNRQYHGVGANAGSYCQIPSLAFDKDNDPGYILYKRGDNKTTTSLITSVADTVSDTISSAVKQLRTGNLLSDTPLVQSNIPEHSAIDLCESKTSVGPDFVSTVEGVMCDMGTKQHMPLCAIGVLGRCFDLKTTSVLVDGLLSAVEGIWNYSKIEVWDDRRAEDAI
ncbi:hypothetical protein KCU93_g10075, partial [Aureobasidium melanogenum]